MRKVIENQYSFGNTDISKINLDPRCRDEMTKLLRGLIYIYTNDEIRTEVFNLLETEIKPEVSKKTGRKGMDIWKILVLAVVKQGCNIDFDKLHYNANSDILLREMLGHGRDDWKDTYNYPHQTLVDNVSLLTPELLLKINEIVNKAGHKLLSKKKLKNCIAV